MSEAPTFIDDINQLLRRREVACTRIDGALKHMSREEMLFRVTSWLEVTKLEEIADIMEGRP